MSFYDWMKKKNSQNVEKVVDDVGDLISRGKELFGLQKEPKIAPGSLRNTNPKPYATVPATNQEGTVSGLVSQAAEAPYTNRLVASSDDSNTPVIQQKPLQAFVKPEYVAPIQSAAQEFRVDPKIVAAIINVENDTWVPERKAMIEGDTSVGLGQINNATYTDIKKIIGDFDRTNAKESIRAISAWVNNISRRIESIEPTDIARAYNRGVSGFLNQPSSLSDGYVEKFLNSYDTM